jgi:hypothetical protein
MGQHSQPPHRGAVKAALNSDGAIIVIKVGTSSLVRPEQQTLNLTTLARICETVKALHTQGHHVIIVTSGAVGVGCQRLGLKEKPTQLARKQALAAVGQVHLMRYYEDFFNALGLPCAQVLLTLDNLVRRAALAGPPLARPAPPPWPPRRRRRSQQRLPCGVQPAGANPAAAAAG